MPPWSDRVPLGPVVESPGPRIRGMFNKAILGLS